MLFKISFFIKNIKMPPKKVTQNVKQQKKSQSIDIKQKQTKLFTKEVILEQPKLATKNRTKQFNHTQVAAEHGKSNQKDWLFGTGKTPQKLLISSWNVNGIRAVLTKGDLMNYLKKSQPDIICINQTKIGQQAFKKQKINIEGYNCYWNFCKSSQGYSGVAIFSKYLPLSVKQDLPQSQHSHQGRVLTMQFQKFNLVTAYIPNSGQKLDRLQYRTKNYDKCFQQYCNSLNTKKMTIICGDLNVCHKQIDIAKPKGNQKTAGFTLQERESFSKWLDQGWVDTFRYFYPDLVKYSWWSMRTGGRAKNIGWRLDYFIVGKEHIKAVKDSRINNDVFGSDHCPCEIDILLK